MRTLSCQAYTAWYESAPASPVGTMNMVVSPNDQVQKWAWEANSACNNTAGGGYACFFYQDVSTGVSFSSGAISAPDNGFAGATAEAVIEKQGGLPLASWSTASEGLYVQDSNSDSWRASGSNGVNPRGRGLWCARSRGHAELGGFHPGKPGGGGRGRYRGRPQHPARRRECHDPRCNNRRFQRPRSRRRKRVLLGQRGDEERPACGG
jgi:hypothetical protein